jgi:plasmid stabilization system protein ParE
MSGYDFHPEGAVDLDEIWDFIAEDNLEAADKMIAAILANIDALVSFPNQGRKLLDLTSRPLPFFHGAEYLIAYTRRKTLCDSSDAPDGAAPRGRNPQRQRAARRRETYRKGSFSPVSICPRDECF